MAAVPTLYRNLNRAIDGHLEAVEPMPPLLCFGFWIGGDQDGNSLAKRPETTFALRIQACEALDENLRWTNRLQDVLTQLHHWYSSLEALNADWKAMKNS